MQTQLLMLKPSLMNELFIIIFQFILCVSHKAFPEFEYALIEFLVLQSILQLLIASFTPRSQAKICLAGIQKIFFESLFELDSTSL